MNALAKNLASVFVLMNVSLLLCSALNFKTLFEKIQTFKFERRTSLSNDFEKH